MLRLPGVGEPVTFSASRCTVPLSARPKRPDGRSAKLTTTLVGMNTCSTLARSGMTPPQLAGSNQLEPSPPPVQVTEARRRIVAEAVVDAEIV